MTRVITAHSMITKVKRSLYVTIVPASFAKSGGWYRTPTGPWVNKLFWLTVKWGAPKSRKMIEWNYNDIYQNLFKKYIISSLVVPLFFL